jgi:hypothetical protein
MFSVSKRIDIFYYTVDLSLILGCKSPLFAKERVGYFWCTLQSVNI